MRKFYFGSKIDFALDCVLMTKLSSNPILTSTSSLLLNGYCYTFKEIILVISAPVNQLIHLFVCVSALLQDPTISGLALKGLGRLRILVWNVFLNWCCRSQIAAKSWNCRPAALAKGIGFIFVKEYCCGLATLAEGTLVTLFYTVFDKIILLTGYKALLLESTLVTLFQNQQVVLSLH